MIPEIMQEIRNWFNAMLWNAAEQHLRAQRGDQRTRYVASRTSARWRFCSAEPKASRRSVAPKPLPLDSDRSSPAPSQPA
jgi:hypothetical protein